jgi:hypothetical protein
MVAFRDPLWSPEFTKKFIQLPQGDFQCSGNSHHMILTSWQLAHPRCSIPVGIGAAMPSITSWVGNDSAAFGVGHTGTMPCFPSRAQDLEVSRRTFWTVVPVESCPTSRSQSRRGWGRGEVGSALLDRSFQMGIPSERLVSGRPWKCVLGSFHLFQDSQASACFFGHPIVVPRSV